LAVLFGLAAVSEITALTPTRSAADSRRAQSLYSTVPCCRQAELTLARFQAVTGEMLSGPDVSSMLVQYTVLIQYYRMMSRYPGPLTAQAQPSVLSVSIPASTLTVTRSP
jgi:hypothetical protein